MADLREIVFQALGQASMCWDERPTGIFDSRQAVKVGDDLVAAIEGYYKQPALDTVAEMPMEKCPSKLEMNLGKMRALSEDVGYLMARVEQHSLATIDEHVEVQEEIHELQRMLADCDAYVTKRIAEMAVDRFIGGQVKMTPKAR
jgi:hypothetical protein